MGKEYALELEFSHDLEAGRTLGVFSRGHHHPADFLARYRQDWTGSSRAPLRPVMLQDVKRAWQRNVPGPNGWSMHVICERPGPGAYPVTFVDFQEIDFPIHRLRNELCALGCSWKDATSRVLGLYSFLSPTPGRQP